MTERSSTGADDTDRPADAPAPPHRGDHPAGGANPPIDPPQPWQSRWRRFWPLLAWAALVLVVPAAVALVGTPAPEPTDFARRSRWELWHEALPTALLVSVSIGGLFVAAGRRTDQMAKLYTVLLGLGAAGLAGLLLQRVLAALQ